MHAAAPDHAQAPATNAAAPWPPFLASEIPDRPAEACLFHVLPAPIEETVSYGHGTAGGPRALLEASCQLEAWDGHSCPCEHGIFTHPPAETLDDIEQRTAAILAAGGIPVLLGGEHTVSLGAFRALAKRQTPVGIVHFDAHADLRDTYEGNPLSHACVMRRALELGLPILQLGIRSLSLAEVGLQRTCPALTCFTAHQMMHEGMPADWLPHDFPAEVYVTFDVDALDPSIMPATGTPEPGGLHWWPTMHLLEQVARTRRIIGLDCVELAPVATMHAPAFTAARLVYNLMGWAERSAKNLVHNRHNTV